MSLMSRPESLSRAPLDFLGQAPHICLEIGGVKLGSFLADGP